MKNKSRFYIFMESSIARQDWLYVLKCVLGASACYALYAAFPQFPFFWSLVTVVLVISPENDRKLPYLRIEGNVLGSAIGLLLFFLPLPTLISLCLGVSLSIITGFLLKLQMSIRTAIAATIIVLFQEKAAHSWDVALARVGCVLVGCAVGFIITILFTELENRNAKKKKTNSAEPE